VSPASDNIYFAQKLGMTIGFIRSAGTDVEQHFFIGKHSRDDLSIKGLVFGSGANNHGVFIAKHKPATVKLPPMYGVQVNISAVKSPFEVDSTLSVL
jgi:hypothetical protein